MTDGGLNDRQREAVSHPPGRPLVVFAGAGSGKTRVITQRVAWLVREQNVPPSRILAVTFTNKAAAELRERLALLLPGSGVDGRGSWVGTFHSTCARLLRTNAEQFGVRRGFTIYDDADQKALITRIVRDFDLSETVYEPRYVSARIQRIKQEMASVSSVAAGDLELERILHAYEERLKQADALDFGDLIYRVVERCEHEESLRQQIAGMFDHVLVDEFQDTNRVQFKLVHQLAREHRNLCVVGDDDQSIYRWRGADRRNILDFRRAFPDAIVVKLEQNYRSTQRILRLAHAVISHNRDREPKELWTENAEGAAAVVVRSPDEREEARALVTGIRRERSEGRGLSEMAVLYRTHAQSRVLEEALRAYDIPYQIVGGTRFYDRAEVKDLLAYLRVLQQPKDDVSLLRILNVPARGIGKTTVERVLDLALRRGASVWEVLEAPDETAFGAGACLKLAAFVALIRGLQTELAAGAPVAQLGESVVERSGYLAMLQEDESVTASARLENVRELLGSMADFQGEAENPGLAGFLELVTLHTTADDLSADERLTLLTVHAAKGLEFKVVHVAGLEEDLFPLRGRAADDDDEHLEEERRLAYVAFTRARERLCLHWAVTRHIMGQWRTNRRSRFIEDLPSQDLVLTGEPQQRPASFGFTRPERPAVRRPSSSESYVDRSDGDLGEGGVHRGMRVRHSHFGVGRVESVSEGVPPRVTVQFPGWGVKKILADRLEPA